MESGQQRLRNEQATNKIQTKTCIPQIKKSEQSFGESGATTMKYSNKHHNSQAWRVETLQKLRKYIFLLI